MAWWIRWAACWVRTSCRIRHGPSPTASGRAIAATASASWDAGEGSAQGPVYMTQGDVRELQMAKAAVRTGVEVLLQAAGIKAEDLSEILLAGAFGTFLAQGGGRGHRADPARPHRSHHPRGQRGGRGRQAGPFSRGPNGSARRRFWGSSATSSSPTPRISTICSWSRCCFTVSERPQSSWHTRSLGGNDG